MTHTNTDQLEIKLSNDLKHTLKLLPASQRDLFVSELASYIAANYTPKTEVQISGNKTTRVDAVNNSARTNKRETGDATA